MNIIRVLSISLLYLPDVDAFGTPIQVLRPKLPASDSQHRNAMGEWHLTSSGKAILENIPGPISIATVVGPYHSGKSYFLNQLMRQFPPTDESAIPKGAEAFPVGYSIHPETRGLWLWSDILQICISDESLTNYTWIDGTDRTQSSSITTLSNCPEADIRHVIFCDTEGFHSPGVDEISDAKMFAIAFLMSTELLYNSVKLIDQQQVEYLELLTRRSALFGLRSFATSSQANTDDNHPLLGSLLQPPSLTWCVQDFIQDLNEQTPIEWLSNLFIGTPTERFISSSKDLSASLPLGSLFTNIDAQTFPPPIFTNDGANDGLIMTQKLDLVPDEQLYRPYRDTVSAFTKRFVKRIAKHPKQKDAVDGGGYFTGRDVVHLLDFLVEASKDAPAKSTETDDAHPTINQLFPHLPSVWEQFHKFQTNLIISDLVSDYKGSMDAFQAQAYQNFTIQKRMPLSAISQLYIGPPNILPIPSTTPYSIRDINASRKSSLIKEHTDNMSFPIVPLPSDWYPKWSSAALERILKLMKHHIKASGAPVTNELQVVLSNSDTNDLPTRQLLRLLLSKVVKWCPEKTAVSESKGALLFKELNQLPFVQELFTEIRAQHELLKSQYDQSVDKWCTWTQSQIRKGIDWLVEELTEEQSTVWSIPEANQFSKSAPTSYLQFWRAVTNYPGRYCLAMEVSDDNHMDELKNLLVLPDPTADPSVCSDNNLPPYPLPSPDDIHDFQYNYSTLKGCQDASIALKTKVEDATSHLSDLMLQRRGVKLWEYLKGLIYPFTQQWGICLKPEIKIDEWDVFSNTQYENTERFAFNNPPQLNANHFEPCRDQNKMQNMNLLSIYSSIEEVLSAFDERRNHIVMRILHRESDDRYEMDARPKSVYDWLLRSVFPALEDSLIANWEQQCMDDSERKIKNQMQRLVSRVKATVAFPAIEEELQSSITSEASTARSSLIIDLDHCLKIDNAKISNKVNVPNLIRERMEEEIARYSEHLNHQNLLAIRGLAGEPLRRMFQRLQKEAELYYSWSNFLEEAYERAELVIAKASEQNGDLWPKSLIRKVARMSVEEMTLPLGIEGSHYSHASHQLLMAVDQQYKLYDDECSDVLWYDVPQQIHCYWKNHAEGSVSLLKGVPYSIIEDNQFVLTGRVLFIFGTIHATLSLFIPNGSPLIRLIFGDDNRFARLIGGPSYGQVVRETIIPVPSPRTMTYIEETKVSYEHITDRSRDGSILSPFLWSIRQFICMILCWGYSSYCLLIILGIFGRSKSDLDNADHDIFKLAIFWIFKAGGYAGDIFFYCVLTSVRRILSAAYIVFAKPSSTNLYPNSDLKHIEEARRAWYAFPVWLSSFCLWTIGLFVIPHLLIDNWSSIYIRLTCPEIDRSDDTERMTFTQNYHGLDHQFDCHECRLNETHIPCENCAAYSPPHNPSCNRQWIGQKELYHGSNESSNLGNFLGQTLDQCQDSLNKSVGVYRRSGNERSKYPYD